MPASSSMERYHCMKAVYGDVFDKVWNSRVLVVGAGGIGCELLKNLVLSGFRTIEVIDLDTIAMSNLNRQFLFRQHHVGQPKSEVAVEQVRKFNSDVNLKAHVGNIKDDMFDVNFFKTFDIVLNALDNLDARRHVNKMCLTAGVPLVESGTSGYQGQVTAHKKDLFECFDCRPKPIPKTFPICTIRSNPSTIVHCLVWAKMFFAQLFGKGESISEVNDGDDDDGVADVETTAVKLSKSGNAAGEAFDKVFYTDIMNLLEVREEAFWHMRHKPTPIRFNDLIKGTNGIHVEWDKEGHSRDLRRLSNEENAVLFRDCISVLTQRNAESVEWDKDDPEAMDFVAAAANLRASIFGIDSISRFDACEKAGNIIPAIASTNAIVSGLIIKEAIALISGNTDACRATYVRQTPTYKGVMLQPTHLPEPNKKCGICQRSTVEVSGDLGKHTLLDLAKCLKEAGVEEPCISIAASLFYEEGEDLEEDEIQMYSSNGRKLLGQIGTVNGSILNIQDNSNDLMFEVVFVQCDSASELFVKGKIPDPEEANEEESGDESSDLECLDEAALETDDEIICLNDTHLESPNKRQRTE